MGNLNGRIRKLEVWQTQQKIVIGMKSMRSFVEFDSFLLIFRLKSKTCITIISKKLLPMRGSIDGLRRGRRLLFSVYLLFDSAVHSPACLIRIFVYAPICGTYAALLTTFSRLFDLKMWESY